MSDQVDLAHLRGLHRLGTWLALLAGAAFLLPRLCTWGTYVDGTLYAAIARNMAVGKGTCWDPFYTETLYPHFTEHPPLGLILESVFYRVFGDPFWVEKLYSLCVLLATLVGMRLCWRETARIGGRNLERYFWATALTWILMPLWPWMYRNNMLENTLLLFCMWSIACIMRAESLPAKRALPWYAGAVAALCAAFLSKGPFSLFPLAAPAIVSLVRDRRISLRSLCACAGLAIATAAILFALTLYDPIGANLENYYQKQVAASLSGERGAHAKGRLYLMWGLAEQLMVVALPIMVIAFIARRKNSATSGGSGWTGLIPILVGLSASVPLLVSPRHAKHYLGTSLPFFAMGFGYFLADALRRLTENSRRPWLQRLPRWPQEACIALLVVVAGISLYLFGKPVRDEELHREIALIASEASNGAIVGADRDISRDWPLVAYLYRFHMISLDGKKSGKRREFYLAKETLPGAFTALPVELPDKYLFGKRAAAVTVPNADVGSPNAADDP
jgi:4-amino-4-deoxy-L-arabinose transferase-like glycosyltransferase